MASISQRKHLHSRVTIDWSHTTASDPVSALWTAMVTRPLGELFDFLERPNPGQDNGELFDGLINAGLVSEKGSAIRDCEGALRRSGRLSLLISSLALASSSRMLGFGGLATGKNLADVLPTLPICLNRLTLKEILPPR